MTKLVFLPLPHSMISGLSWYVNMYLLRWGLALWPCGELFVFDGKCEKRAEGVRRRNNNGKLPVSNEIYQRVMTKLTPSNQLLHRWILLCPMGEMRFCHGIPSHCSMWGWTGLETQYAYTLTLLKQEILLNHTLCAVWVPKGLNVNGTTKKFRLVEIQASRPDSYSNTYDVACVR